MQLETLQALQIHGVRWLSRGQVIERLVVLMPPILTLWKNEKKTHGMIKQEYFQYNFVYICLEI